MDEARRVRERLRRIEALRAERAGHRSILPELHALVDEARACAGACAEKLGGERESGRVAASVDRRPEGMIPM